MRRLAGAIVIALTLIQVGEAWSTVSEKSGDSYSQVDAILLEKQLQYGIDEVLLVLDLDNTLLTMDTDLGSDVWYRWQNYGIDGVKASELDKVKCPEGAMGMLFELNTMHVVEQAIPSFITSWTQKGLSMMVLTSRSPKYRVATERELKRNHLDFSQAAIRRIGEVSEFSYMALNKGTSKTASYSVADLREVSYRNGILMTSGAHKGVMLDQILEKTGRQFDAIVVVDDTKANIDNIKDTYSSRAGVDVTLVHYTRVEQERIQAAGKVLTEAQARKMVDDWKTLEKSLNDLFPTRKEMECVRVLPRFHGQLR